MSISTEDCSADLSIRRQNLSSQRTAQPLHRHRGDTNYAARIVAIFTGLQTLYEDDTTLPSSSSFKTTLDQIVEVGKAVNSSARGNAHTST